MIFYLYKITFHRYRKNKLSGKVYNKHCGALFTDININKNKKTEYVKKTNVL